MKKNCPKNNFFQKFFDFLNHHTSSVAELSRISRKQNLGLENQFREIRGAKFRKILTPKNHQIGTIFAYVWGKSIKYVPIFILELRWWFDKINFKASSKT